jgi:hypothetical protein
MRDHDGAADDQAHGERFLELGRGHAAFGALDDMVADAVVAPQHERSDEAEQFFGLCRQRAVFIRFTVEAGVRRSSIADYLPSAICHGAF